MSDDSESALELAAIALFVETGFDHSDLQQEFFGEEDSHGREASFEVVFKEIDKAFIRKPDSGGLPTSVRLLFLKRQLANEAIGNSTY